MPPCRGRVYSTDYSTLQYVDPLAVESAFKPPRLVQTQDPVGFLLHDDAIVAVLYACYARWLLTPSLNDVATLGGIDDLQG